MRAQDPDFALKTYFLFQQWFCPESSEDQQLSDKNKKVFV